MNLQRWQDRQKGKAIRMLKELTKRIEREELIVNDAGFWTANGSNEITFRVIVISRDSGKELERFKQIS